MEKEIKDKLDQLGRAFEQFKEANDKEIKEIKTSVTATGLTIEKAEKINETISSLQDEIKSLKAAAVRPSRGEGNPTQAEADELKVEYRKAYNNYLRKGGVREERKLMELEAKAMSVESDADGGFLVPQEMSSEIVTKVFESSPLRQLASIQTISTGQLEMLEDLGEAGSGWVAESGSRSSQTTPALKKIMIPVHELYTQLPATQTLLDDAQINVEQWLAGKVAEKFSRDEATAFVSGNGVGKPKGLLSYTSGTTGFNDIEQVVSGSAATLTADGLIDLIYSLKEPYHKNATLLMQRATEKVARKLKDSQNRYLWEPGLNGSRQNSLLGYNIQWAADMGTIGANALVIAFGDFKQGYQIVDRIGMRVIRDVYTSKPNVLFYCTKRVGGGVKNFEAIKIQKCST